jgi:nitroreductase
MDLLEAIKNRRSIRKLKVDPVDEKILETILESARLAPSWANTQCWKFIVVRDVNLKAQIADTLITHGASGVNRASEAIRVAPVLIVGCAEKNVAGYYQGTTPTDKGDTWLMFDVALAMEHIVLTATSFGLGTVLVGLFDYHKVEALLGIPENHCVVAMTPIGYPQFQPEPRPRKKIEEIVFYEKFGQPKS